LLGKSYYSDSEYSKALSLLQDSVKVFENLGSEGLEAEKLARNLIVRTYYELEKPDKATQHCVAIGAINEKLGKNEPELIIKMKHDYAKPLLKKGLSAYVTVEYRISEEGYVEDPRVVESTDPKFNKSALRSVKNGRFAPKVIDGKPVSMQGQKIKLHMGKDAILEFVDELKERIIPPEGDIR